LACVSLESTTDGLFGPVPSGELLGLVVLGRPVARNLPQDGSCAEITRFVLRAGLPRETASHLLRAATELWFGRPRSARIVTYHDRSRHTGCIYKKAGYRKDGVTRPGRRQGSWASRTGSRAQERRGRHLSEAGAVLPGIESTSSAEGEWVQTPSKRRWTIDRAAVLAAVARRLTSA
jgi:hypothetical protein